MTPRMEVADVCHQCNISDQVVTVSHDRKRLGQAMQVHETTAASQLANLGESAS